MRIYLSQHSYTRLITGAPMATDTRWTQAKAIIGTERVTLGPVASHSWVHQPEHLAFQLARYRAAAALIGNAKTVLEVGAGEGIGARILARGRASYLGIDTDREALEIAARQHFAPGAESLPAPSMAFEVGDALAGEMTAHEYEAVVALDIIEHIPAEREADFMRTCMVPLAERAACVIGTPNAAFDHLASPQSRAGHVNTYTYERLHALMTRYFPMVQMFGMQDTALHFGHPDARHYLFAVGIGPGACANCGIPLWGCRWEVEGRAGSYCSNSCLWKGNRDGRRD
jgi:2-polyprenyl-3-methyl-5-hydroxy-6-metoxy-1,4-benzoquinol methylase